MIIDNFEQIIRLLEFKSEDEFYHLQIFYFPSFDFLT